MIFITKVCNYYYYFKKHYGRTLGLFTYNVAVSCLDLTPNTKLVMKKRSGMFEVPHKRLREKGVMAWT